ncbi:MULTISPECIES: hypothetical protein [Fructobacillus]|uniref:Bacteriocin n=1 Tax=Fructobacillus tropaeoli TaxID=709323 RepID=A0ABM9N245_9LACO|nr:unnamed protein product [Fructobacillus sp. LMG 32999]CAK1254598.1 unnamed protein product [Fructobacillus tropaeoli]
MNNFSDLNDQTLAHISGGSKDDYKAGHFLGRFTKYALTFGMRFG